MKRDVTIEQIRQAAEADLSVFIKLVAPDFMLGEVHEEAIKWWNRKGASNHQLLLLPRDHLKSTLIAFRTVWWITRDPTVTILYVSATSTLAEKQLLLIKNILTSPQYRKYWPEMVRPEESKRAKWTNAEIIVDHPLREAKLVKDSTIFTAGLNTTITGQHYDVVVLDDMVVEENVATEEGRDKVRSYYSLLASVETTNSREWVVGTRYRPTDLYNELLSKMVEEYDDAGQVKDYQPLFEVFERKVEDKGDGTGKFLWPRAKAPDGKWYGFDAKELAKKRAKYLDKTLYRAQYYNDPNSAETQSISANCFQYYDPRFIKNEGGTWYFQGNPLNLYASVDFAFSTKKRADWTSIAVVGMASDGRILVLDLDRFKTDSIADYYQHIKRLYVKWGFRKLRAEVTVAQQSIVRELKDRYIKDDGLFLSIDPHRPDARGGAKEVRIQTILEPKYKALSVWHYKGGLISALEEELLQAHPAHDDLKNAVADAMEIATPPVNKKSRVEAQSNVVYGRFGGFAG